MVNGMLHLIWDGGLAQTENQKRVFSMAEEMLKRVAEFIKRFDKVGKDIELLQRDYNEAYNKASTGKQSIAQKANELKELGLHPAAIPASSCANALIFPNCSFIRLIMCTFAPFY